MTLLVVLHTAPLWSRVLSAALVAIVLGVGVLMWSIAMGDEEDVS